MFQCFECKMTKNGKQTIHEIPEFVSVTSELVSWIRWEDPGEDYHCWVCG